MHSPYEGAERNGPQSELTPAHSATKAPAAQWRLSATHSGGSVLITNGYEGVLPIEQLRHRPSGRSCRQVRLHNNSCCLVTHAKSLSQPPSLACRRIPGASRAPSHGIGITPRPRGAKTLRDMARLWGSLARSESTLSSPRLEGGQVSLAAQRHDT